MKKPSHSSRFVFPFLLLCTGLIVGCSSSIELTSHWKDHEISIDGQLTDWQNATTTVEKSHASLGVKNDDDYVYICFSTNERRTQMQMLVFGFTVWLDPEGGKNKTLGIRYPVRSGLPARRLFSRENPEDLRQLLESIPYEFEILGPGKEDRQRVLFIDAKGINARLGAVQGTIVYELKIPLRKTNEHPIAISTENVKKLGICFETTEPMQDAAGGRSISTRPTGGGRSGGRGSGRGGATPPSDISGGSQRPESLSLWATVELSSGLPASEK